MSALLAALWAAVQPALMSLTSKLAASFTAILGSFSDEEKQALVDAKTKFIAEYRTKGLEQAAADAWTTFFDESKTNISAAARLMFKAWLAAFGVPQSI